MFLAYFDPTRFLFTDFFSTANQPKTSQNIRLYFIEITHRVTYIQRLCFQTDNDLSSEFLQISNYILVSLLIGNVNQGSFSRNTSRQIFPRGFYKLVKVSCFYNKNSFHIVNNSTVIAFSGHVLNSRINSDLILCHKGNEYKLGINE